MKQELNIVAFDGPKQKIYLAGPMSGYEDFNFPAFFKAAAFLEKIGWEVFNPAAEDLKEWGTLEKTKACATYRFCLKKDLSWICDHAEAIAFLPGWEKSKGVQAEKALAEALGLKQIYLTTEGNETL